MGEIDGIDGFYDEFKQYEADAEVLHDELTEEIKKLSEAQERIEAEIGNIRIIANRNHETQKQIIQETRDLLQAWKTAEGAVRAAVFVGNFFKWISGAAVVGWALTEIFRNTK